MPILAKVQERCVLVHLLPHVSPYLFNMQHGFLIKVSHAPPSCCKVLHELGWALDSGLETDVIYLDFSKAFDSVCSAKLLSKLCTFRTDGLRVISLVDNSGLSLMAVFHPSWGMVKSGVPQGSNLGPGARFSKVPKLDRRISGDMILFVFSKRRHLVA